MNNRMTIEEAAQLMEKTEQWIRVGLQKGVFPWGYAVKNKTMYSYFISRPKFEECTGIRTKG